jgi:hypothetical protein
MSIEEGRVIGLNGATSPKSATTSTLPLTGSFAYANVGAL